MGDSRGLIAEDEMGLDRVSPYRVERARFAVGLAWTRPPAESDGAFRACETARQRGLRRLTVIVH